MKRIKVGIVVLCIMAVILSLSACGGDQNKNAATDQEDMRQIVDAAGREVLIPKEVDTLVCLGVGSLRFTIYNNGIDKVVGVEDIEKDVPVTKPAIYAYRDKISTLPSIGTAAEPNTEALIQLAPDVIISSNEKGNADTITYNLVWQPYPKTKGPRFIWEPLTLKVPTVLKEPKRVTHPLQY